MKKGGRSETYVHLYHDHEQENATTYQTYMYYGVDRGWSETYIHLSHHRQKIIFYCECVCVCVCVNRSPEASSVTE